MKPLFGLAEASKKISHLGLERGNENKGRHHPDILLWSMYQRTGFKQRQTYYSYMIQSLEHEDKMTKLRVLRRKGAICSIILYPNY